MSESGELLLVFADLVSEGYFKQDDSRQLEALKTVISNVTGPILYLQILLTSLPSASAYAVPVS